MKKPAKTMTAPPSKKVAASKKATPPKAAARPKTKLSDQAPAGSNADVLDRLYGVIMDRRMADPTRSHSARLLSRGPAKVAQKFGEEAVECLIEAVAGNASALVGESADVLYHLLVMWVASGVRPEQVWDELRRREGISGVDEKASRAGTSKIP